MRKQTIKEEVIHKKKSWKKKKKQKWTWAWARSSSRGQESDGTLRGFLKDFLSGIYDCAGIRFNPPSFHGRMNTSSWSFSSSSSASPPPIGLSAYYRSNSQKNRIAKIHWICEWTGTISQSHVFRQRPHYSCGFTLCGTDYTVFGSTPSSMNAYQIQFVSILFARSLSTWTVWKLFVPEICTAIASGSPLIVSVTSQQLVRIFPAAVYSP